MNFRFVVPSQFGVAVFFGKSFLLITALCLSVESAKALDFSVGAKQVIYTKSQRSKKGLASWPDGSLGVVANGNGTYDFYGANSTKPTWTTGTLTDPAQSKKTINITGLPKKTFSYVSGGPIYRDSSSGERLLIYHAEKSGKTASSFHSMLGLAVATDPSSTSFRDLGTIIEPNLQSGATEVGGGSFAVINGYLNVYYRDAFASGGTSELAVARASLSDLLNNSWKGVATSFTKYFNGSWSQPGRGGLASALEVGNPNDGWSAVSYNDYLNQTVMVTSQHEAGGGDLYMSTSSDGINWAPRQAIALDAGEQFYPSIVGTGADPQHSGQSFYVYYTDSQKGGFKRWKDAQLDRRLITLNPFTPPIVPAPVVTAPPTTIPPPQPTLTDWATISDYRTDFQGGGPAAGWKYDWDPTGKLGNSSVFAPLRWSNSAQAYNTTGGVTTAYNQKSHNDDYLSLTAGGGHPGRPKYLAIVGYTVQADDGAGSYQIGNSSITKDDAVASSGEDGIQVLIYVNNKQLGSQQVLTNGQLATFNYTLGQLNVGDTVWVMVDPLKNQNYDAFTNFDFAIQKLVPAAQLVQAAAIHSSLSLSAAGVPEPGSATLLAMGLVVLIFWRRASGLRLPA
ncbi:MAG TPA: hypothetical protein VGM76_15585 [Lacipirellulaceae bacterium]|jgi:hypothetical protein